MIKFKHYGDFKKTERFFKRASKINIQDILKKFGKEGVEALSAATPERTGVTKDSWDYEIITSSKSSTIIWTNSNIVHGVSIAIILQYGHGTKNGGYVQGRDYINPAIQPIFDKLADEAWREVTRNG